MNTYLRFVLTLPLMLLSPPALAASPDAVTTADTVVVTARGYAASLSETPGSVGVVTQKDLALSPRASIADSLRRITGLARTGDSPWGQGISIRGLSAGHVIVLLDGKRINTATDMNARLGFINPDDVAHIEVLKGPVSALYGSGSTGGVVNIITRKAAFTKEAAASGRLAGTASSNPGGGSAYANAALSGPRAWGFVSGAYREFGDTFGGEHTHIANSDFLDTQGRAMLGVKPWDPLTLTLQAVQSTGNDIGIPGGSASMPAMARVRYPRTFFSFLAADAALDLEGEYLKSLEASLYITRNKRRVHVDRNPPAALPYPLSITPSADHETLGGSLQGTIMAGNHTFVTGADFWTWSITSQRVRELQGPASRIIRLEDSPTPRAEQISAGFFAEDDWKLGDDLTLNFGARLDMVVTANDPMYLVTPQTETKLYGHKTERNLGRHLHTGLTWTASDAWRHSVLLASSYRAADIMERFKYISLGGGVDLYGNPDLDPEKSWYAEYGLGYTKGPFTADFRLFANIITDYIAEKRVNKNRIQLLNVTDARICGTELDLRWELAPAWNLYGSLAALYSRDEENSQPLPGLAPVTGRLALEYAHPSGFTARLENDLIAPQRSTPDTTDSTPGVILFGAAFGYSRTTGKVKHDLWLRLDNIGDSRYYSYLAHQRGITVWEAGFAATLSYALHF